MAPFYIIEENYSPPTLEEMKRYIQEAYEAGFNDGLKKRSVVTSSPIAVSPATKTITVGDVNGTISSWVISDECLRGVQYADNTDYSYNPLYVSSAVNY